MIKGIDVILYERVRTGVDPFNEPIFEEIPAIIHNVLVSPVSSDDVTDTTNLKENKATYKLCIPKGDKHEWSNRVVEFFGRKWKTVGMPAEYIEDLLPLQWNKQIEVERYGN